jgi:colicin import membrane protein
VQAWMTEMRKTKQAAWEREKKEDAVRKAQAEAETKARFKASEHMRRLVEAENRARERSNAKKARETHRRKVEEEKRKKKEAMKAAAEALKEALKEAMAAQYEMDEKGKMTKKLDPTKELMKKMRLLEAEQAQMQRNRDAAIAAKEAAFRKKEEEQAFQRQLQMEAAKREVDAIFKKNQVIEQPYRG